MAAISGAAAHYHIYVYGKYQDPVFHQAKVCAESLSTDRVDVTATVEAFFETQYEQQLRSVVRQHGGAFEQAKRGAPLIFAETEDAVLYFLNIDRFLDWALKRFKYEDSTRLVFYKRIGSKALEQAKERSGRTYCEISFLIEEESQAKQTRLQENLCKVVVVGFKKYEEPAEDELRDCFSTFGSITNLEMKVGKGSCVVTFDSKQAADATIANAKNIQVGGKKVGVEPAVQQGEIVQVELFDDECPKLAKNFLELLASPQFDGHPVHRVKAGAWVQAGDLVNGSGLHSEAAAGGLLEHESYMTLHDRPGLLGMCCHGQDTVGSQFYITMRDLAFLDGKFVAFGRVIVGMRTLNKISKMKTKNERPVCKVSVFAGKD